jgi:hypothetical protein
MKWSQTKWLLPSIIIILGIGLRLLVATRGHNFDFDSFLIVLDIVKHRENVYAETTRYNYGPVWFNTIFILDMCAAIFHSHFRYFLVGFLSMVDLGIFFVLWRKVGRTAAYLFFLNPVSIIITGYHNQFDNLAILLGLLSIIIFGDDFEKTLSPKKQIGLLVLGLSLMTKHILFAFPLWLAVKQKGLLNKIAVIFIPLSVFALGFIPYWKDGQQGIVQNVFLYKSFNNQLFFQFFVPEILRVFTNSHLIWFFLLVAFAVVFRMQNSFNSLLLYTSLLVATSPAIANQYIAIPIAFIVVNPNPFLFWYVIIGTWHLTVNPDGLHVSAFQSNVYNNYYPALIILLCFGFIWNLWRQDILTFIKNGISEIKSAFV